MPMSKEMCWLHDLVLDFCSDKCHLESCAGCMVDVLKDYIRSED